jgi:hypothetical protein
MANKGRRGIGVAECPFHGEYFLDAKDSPCPSCEDGVPRPDERRHISDDLYEWEEEE